MGDPAGIGPEICAKALGGSGQAAGVHERCLPFVIGDYKTMRSQERYAGGRHFVRIDSPAALPSLPADGIGLYQPKADLEGVRPGELSAAAGRAAGDYVRGAVDLALAGEVQGIVTAPLNKAALHLGGFDYPGHTEMLGEWFGVKKYAMVLAAEGRYVFHVTTHMALRDAVASLSIEKVYSRIYLAHLLALALEQPDDAIAVAGVNPHAGEGGLFGDEEIRVVGPAVRQAVASGIPAEGPLPADVLFPRLARGKYHFAIAMYHDQGHAVFKSLYFDTGVNITIGLPVIRTSVDHGTAFDIAGKGIAKEESMIEAVLMAARLGKSWGEISRRAQLQPEA
jgi:4-hydroxythreonine-4-phosphate dehydrogenase